MSLVSTTTRTARRAVSVLSRSGASGVRYATSSSTQQPLPRSAPQQIPRNTAGEIIVPARLKPTSPAYYTARPVYHDAMLALDELTRKAKRALEQASVLAANTPLPAPVGSGHQGIWLKSRDAGKVLGLDLGSAQYRQLVQRLSRLDRYASLVSQHLASGSSASVHNVELARRIEEKLTEFSRYGRDQLRTKKIDTDSLLDEHGRAYSRGRRKESSARVWIIPTKAKLPAAAAADGKAEGSTEDVSAAAVPALGELLVNGQPLSTYFTRSTHREAVLWPMKLTGTLGAFNVFAITRGGGNTGQAGAVAHGLANAIYHYFLGMTNKGGDEARAAEIRAVLQKGELCFDLVALCQVKCTHLMSLLTCNNRWRTQA